MVLVTVLINDDSKIWIYWDWNLFYSFSFSLSLFFPLMCESIHWWGFLPFLWFQMRVSLWFMWFPHVRGRLRSSNSFAWRWNTWQVLWCLWVCQWYVKFSLVPGEEDLVSVGEPGYMVIHTILSRFEGHNFLWVHSVRSNWKCNWRFIVGKCPL